MQKTHFLVILIISILTLSCTSSKKTYKEEVIDGVTHLTNFEHPISEKKLTASTFLEDNPDRDIFLESILDFAVDQSGNFYLLNYKEANILKFNPKGEFITSFAQRGKGPSELNSPRNIVVGDNKVFIAQTQDSRYTVFDTSGKFLFSKETIDIKPGNMWIDRNGLLYNQKNPWMGICTEEDPMFSIFDKKLNLIEKVGKRNVHKDGQLSLFITDKSLAFNKNNKIFVSAKAQNEIKIYETNKLKKIIKRHIYLDEKTPKIEVDKETYNWSVSVSLITRDSFCDKNNIINLISYYKIEDNKTYFVLEKFNNEGILQEIIPLPQTNFREICYSAFHHAIFFLEQNKEENKITKINL